VGVGVVEVGVVGHHVDVDGGAVVGVGCGIDCSRGVVGRRHVDGDRGRAGRVVGAVAGLVGEAKPTRGVAVVGVAGRGEADGAAIGLKHRGAAVGPQEGADRDVDRKSVVEGGGVGGGGGDVG